MVFSIFNEKLSDFGITIVDAFSMRSLLKNSTQSNTGVSWCRIEAHCYDHLVEIPIVKYFNCSDRLRIRPMQFSTGGGRSRGRYQWIRKFLKLFFKHFVMYLNWWMKISMRLMTYLLKAQFELPIFSSKWMILIREKQIAACSTKKDGGYPLIFFKFSNQAVYYFRDDA